MVIALSTDGCCYLAQGSCLYKDGGLVLDFHCGIKELIVDGLDVWVWLTNLTLYKNGSRCLEDVYGFHVRKGVLVHIGYDGHVYLDYKKTKYIGTHVSTNGEGNLLISGIDQLWNISPNGLEESYPKALAAWFTPLGNILSIDFQASYCLNGVKIGMYSSHSITEEDWIVWSGDGVIDGSVSLTLGFEISSAVYSKGVLWYVDKKGHQKKIFIR